MDATDLINLPNDLKDDFKREVKQVILRALYDDEGLQEYLYDAAHDLVEGLPMPQESIGHLEHLMVSALMNMARAWIDEKLKVEDPPTSDS